MNIYEAIEKRRSVRSYREDEPVAEEVLNKILDTGRMAPSAHNSQEYRFIVVKEKDTREELAKASNQRFIAEAPIILVAVSLNPDHIMANQVPAYAMDLAIAFDHISLAAVEEGLGTCWICAFNQEEVKKILDVPKNYKVAALMPLGVPYDDPGVKSRKKLSELVCKEFFSE